MKFTIKCGGKEYPWNTYLPSCNEIPITLYKDIIKMKNELLGVWKYYDWLPIHSIRQFKIGALTFKSNGFSKYLGLENLYISYCGWINGYNETCSFKDISAPIALQRFYECFRENQKIMVLASDGNFARSVLNYLEHFKLKVVIVTTEEAWKNRFWLPKEVRNNNYVILKMVGNYDYTDAILLANKLGKMGKFQLEGGALNIARIDAIGTILIDAAFKMRRMPEHYFQAIGSGVGAIAAFVASKRLRQVGSFGDYLTKIHISQNYPFDPIVDAWKKKSREISKKYQIDEAKELIAQVMAHVLTNRFPAYSIKNGVFDVLMQSNGEAYSITNDEAIKAQKLFEKYEGLNISSPAAVTVASLIEALEEKKINRNDYILLNITAGNCRSSRKFLPRKTIDICNFEELEDKVKIIYNSLLS